MPRVHFVESARKPIPSKGIKVGDSYYHWAFFRGRKQASRTYPKRSQLTQSLWSAVYAAQEDLDAGRADFEMLVELANDVISAAEDAQGEYETAAEAFGGEGPHQERADAADEFGNEARNMLDEIESALDTFNEEVTNKSPEEEIENARDAVDSAVQELVDLELEA